MRDFETFTSKRPRARRRGARKRLSLSFAAALSCLAFFLFGSGVPGSFDGDPEELAERRDLSDGAMNILMVGTDERPDGEFEAMGVRADAIMLARVFPETGEVRVLSMPRDLFVEISPGFEDRVNAAYASGGVEQTERAVENYTGVEIDNHAIVDFEGFEDMVDAAGGVEVDVREGEYPPRSGIEEGPQKLSGEEALFYARFRGTSGGDLDRISRQQQILAAFRSGVLAPGSVTKFPEIVRAAGENVGTNLGLDEAVALAKTMLERGGDAPLETGQLSGEPTTLEDGREVLIPDDERNRRMIEEFLERP